MPSLNTKIGTYIKNRLEAENMSIDALGSIISVSQSALYKKINGTSSFTLEELVSISRAFGISLDELLEIDEDMVSFRQTQFRDQGDYERTMAHLVDQLHRDFDQLMTHQNPKMYYAAKDIPIFWMFFDHQLMAFKLYIWNLMILDEKTKYQPYQTNMVSPEVIAKGDDMFVMYLQAEAVEIWSHESMVRTLQQIEYFHKLGLYTDPDELRKLYSSVRRLLEYMQERCQEDTKYQLYLNNILMLDNSILFESEELNSYFLNFQTLNYMSTTHPQMIKQSRFWFEKQLKKSKIISQSNEEDRLYFFKSLHAVVDASEARVLESEGDVS